MAIPLVSSNISKSATTLSLYKGESKDVRVLITKDGVIPATGEPGDVPVPLNGAIAYFQVKSSASDPRPLISKSSLSPFEITIETPPENGIITIHIESVDTIKLAADTYVFDVWVKLATGKTYPVIQISEFELLQPVTLLG